MYCFLVRDSTPTAYLQYCSVFAQGQTNKEENEWLLLCDILLNKRALVRVCLSTWACLVFLPPIGLCASPSLCYCGDECWLQIVMVFATLIYLAHAGYLARPDCVDVDTGNVSSGGKAQEQSTHNEGDVINQCHTQKVKCHQQSCCCCVPQVFHLTNWALCWWKSHNCCCWWQPFYAEAIWIFEVCFTLLDNRSDFVAKELTLN